MLLDVIVRAYSHFLSCKILHSFVKADPTVEQCLQHLMRLCESQVWTFP